MLCAKFEGNWKVFIDVTVHGRSLKGVLTKTAKTEKKKIIRFYSLLALLLPA